MNKSEYKKTERASNVDKCDIRMVEKLEDNGLIENKNTTIKNIKYSTNGGKLVGKIKYVIFKDAAYIHWIRVSPSYQNEGIGKQLWFEAVSDIKNYSVKIVYTKAVSEGTKRIAKKSGFNQENSLNKNWLSKDFSV